MRWLIASLAVALLMGGSWRSMRRRRSGDVSDPDTWQSLDLIYQQVNDKIEQQWDVWNTVDGRLRFLLGVIGIVFAAALSLRAGAAGASLVLVPWWVAGPAVIAIVLFLAAAGIVARAYAPKDFNWPPNPVGLRNEYLLRDPRQTKLDVIDTIGEAYNANSLSIERKSTAFQRAFVITAVATLLLGVAIIGQVVSNADLAGLEAVWSVVEGHGFGHQ